MNPFIVHKKEIAHPATHALVIGVGNYPFLIGGIKEKTADFVDGMGQLSSPPVSARAFADWLISEHDNLEKPLGTVSLLLSAADDAIYKNPITTEEFSVGRANIANVKTAVRKWKDLGNAGSENQLIFYFCGHGIADGSATTLLLEDYGEVDDNPLEGAVDFSRMRLGLAAACAAREQFHLIDACRASTDTVTGARGHYGDPILIPAPAQPLSRPVLYSTVAGAKAFGRKNSPSYFTESLLTALRGGGADNYPDGEMWSISTTRVKEAIDVYMDRLHAAGKIKRLQTSVADDLSTFGLSRLQKGPKTPVCVSCSISAANQDADLHYAEDGFSAVKREARSPEPWEVTVVGGRKYKFGANFANEKYTPVIKEYEIRPPVRDVKIPVTES